MPNLSCLLNPVGCFTEGVAAWVHSIPLGWLLLAALVVGMILGAWLGKLGVGAVLAAALGVLLFWRRKSDSLPEVEEDFTPPVRPKKPKRPVGVKPKGPQFPPDIY